MKRLKDNSDVPMQGLESCQKQIQAQRERQRHILLARGRIGIAGNINKGAGRKRLCSGFRG